MLHKIIVDKLFFTARKIFLFNYLLKIKEYKYFTNKNFILLKKNGEIKLKSFLTRNTFLGRQHIIDKDK